MDFVYVSNLIIGTGTADFTFMEFSYFLKTNFFVADCSIWQILLWQSLKKDKNP